MKSILAALVVVLAAFLWRNGQVIKNEFFTHSDFPVGYYARGNWKSLCKHVKDEKDHALKYCEDAALWDILSSSGTVKERRVIVSCDPGRKAWNTVMGPLANPNPRGGLWLYSPGKKSAELQHLTLKNYPEGHDFHPLGLDVYPSYGGNASNLFVINHARERSTIEHFTLSPSDPSQATWVNTLVSNYLVSPNSLALTSPTSFYVSNDHLITRRIPTFLSRVLPMTETMLGSPSSWLSHLSLAENHSGHGSPKLRHAFAAVGIAFANGVALSPDGKQVALASSSVSEIYFYSRSPADNTLKLTHTVPMPFSPDNIRFDGEGSLLVTGHPDFPSLMAVAANKTGAFAPSWVLSISPRIVPKVGSPPTSPPSLFDLRAPVSASERVSAVLSHDLETVFQSNGEGFSSSSTALRDNLSGAVYITGLYEEGLLVCGR